METELKLSGDPHVIAGIADAEALVTQAREPGTVRNLEGVYYDTPDHRLHRRGLVLRVRQDGARFVQTIKSEATGGGAVLNRGEWEADLASPAPDLSAVADDALRERIGLILPGELVPVFSTRVRRTILRVTGGDARGRERVIEVALDTGEIVAGNVVEPVSEVELELVEGDAETVYEFALALHRSDTLHVELRSKSERGYALATGNPPRWHKASAVALSRETPVEEALAAALRSCFGQWTANIPAALDGRDPEGVHQMRVGLRRLRSAVVIFRPLLADSDRAWLSREGRFMLRALGPARDLDVFLDELLPAVAVALPGEAALAVLRRAAERRREAAYTAARSAIRSARHTEFVLAFGAWLEGSRWRNGAADVLAAPLDAYSGSLLDDRHRRARKRGRRFAHLSVEERHAVRIALKKLRYATHFFLSAYPGHPTTRYLKRLTRLQGALGHMNDVAVAERLVGEITSAADDPAARDALAQASGLVMGWHARGISELEPATLAAWESFRRATPFWR
jgi:triphosphatase